MPRTALALLAAFAFAPFAGCGPDPDIGAESPGGGAAEIGSFSEIQDRILTPRCATSGCHGGDPPQNYPALDAGISYDAIVNQPSLAASGYDLVTPGDPSVSYLYLTVTDEMQSVGGSGSRMPVGDAPLDASELELIESWIRNGAPND